MNIGKSNLMVFERFLTKKRLKMQQLFRLSHFLVNLLNLSIVYDRFEKPTANRSFIDIRPVRPIIPKIMNV